jgi:type IV pilus assembly protein PilB
LGELLLEKGLISKIALNEAFEMQKKVKKPIGEVLVGMGLVTWDEIYRALADQYEVPLLERIPANVSTQVLSMVPTTVAERLGVIPVEYNPDSKQLKVVTTNVLKVPKIKRELSFIINDKIEIMLMTPANFSTLYKATYGYEAGTESLSIRQSFDLDSPTTEDNAEENELLKEEDETPVARFINSLIDISIKNDASDIHLEPYEKIAISRIRVDGVLGHSLSYPRKVHNSVVSKIKVMCQLDISEKRLPQDGKFYIKKAGEQYDFRVSTMPTIHGEKVVMRLLKVSSSKSELKDLGLSDYNFKRFSHLIDNPHGIILISGPTGSGKSTTLVAVLNQLNSEKVNIITAEDPVEYTIYGVSQCQVNPEINLTFARYLRSFLRQDPDIIMVGEIRDRETAALAIEASLTGHLVLSTIHTNSAPGAISRLINMGVDPFLLNASLLGVVGQRLVRKLCPECKLESPLRDELLPYAEKIYPDKNEFYEYNVGEGCSECRGNSYKGRTGIHEVLINDNRIRDLIIAKSSEYAIDEAARKGGMRTLFEDAIQKVIDGVTSLDEVLRVVGHERE